MLLHAANYRSGFLVDDEIIGGVTEMDGGLFAAYASHYLTGETLAYREFETLPPALEYVAALPYTWAYEGVGCGPKTATVSAGGCGTGAAGGGCKSCSCA